MKTMNNHQLKIRKILTSFGIFSYILAASNINVYPRNLLKNKSFIIKKSAEADLPSSNFYQEHFVNTFLVDNLEEVNSGSDANVLISEIIITGWEDHPEGRKLELAVYDSMSIKPGSIVNNQILKQTVIKKIMKALI